MLLFICMPTFAQNRSNKGKEFWLGYGNNVLFNHDNPINSQTLVLYLSAEEAAIVKVSVNGTSWSQTVSIPANSVDVSVVIPKSGINDARLTTEGKFNKGIHIESDVPIVAYAHQYGLMSSAATMLMPVETYGFTYYSLNYEQVSNYPDSYSWFFVVASEDNTRLKITVADTTQGSAIAKSIPKDTTITVDLNQGEIYNVFGKQLATTTYFNGKDLTGSKIVSVAGSDGKCHPIAVFSGASRNTICAGNGGEFLMQQIFPANAWGTRYVTYHSVNNSMANIKSPFLNIYRIAVRDPKTIVKINGVVINGVLPLYKNFYYQYASVEGEIIESDKPILVGQYTVSSNECTGANPNPLGDPEMLYISPIEQGVKSAIFYNTRNQYIDMSLANIIVPAGAVASMKIDGVPLNANEYFPHPRTNLYTVVVKRLLGAAAQRKITCDSAFVATVYGTGTFESYGYNLGTFVNDLNATGGIRNTLDALSPIGTIDSITCSKTPLKLILKSAYKVSRINWQLSKVLGAGVLPAKDSIEINPVPSDSSYVFGRKYYIYNSAMDVSFSNMGSFDVPVEYYSDEIDNCANSDITSIKVAVKKGPSVDFSISKFLCLPDTVSFSATVNANGFNLTKNVWRIDDTVSVSTLTNRKKFFTSGNHTVRFTTYADNGCAGDTLKVVSIQQNPITNFTVSSTVCMGDSLFFKDASLVAKAGSNMWKWDYGDGTVASKPVSDTANYFYKKPGNYTAKLWVETANGCKSDTTLKQIVVLDKPTAKFNADQNVCIGDTVSLKDASSIGSGSIGFWNWKFGDGTFAQKTIGSPFSYLYTKGGAYTVTLQTLGSNGCMSDSFALQVNVFDKPTPTVSVTGKLCVDSLLTLTSSIAYTPATPITWYWSLPNGNDSTKNGSNIVSITVPGGGAAIKYKHAVNINNGCKSDTLTYTLPLINNSAMPAYTITGDSLCIGKEIIFNSTDTSVVQWKWDFGDGTFGFQAPPIIKKYATAKKYTTSLSYTTKNGCGSKLANVPVTIFADPIFSAGPDLYVLKNKPISFKPIVQTPLAFNYLWSPVNYLNSTIVLAPVVTPSNQQSYNLSVADKVTKCSASDSVTVFIITEVEVPNAFSPNGDGVHDIWQIGGLAGYVSANMEVYNRYGQLVFVSKNGYTKPWDGTYKGKPVPFGTYYYVLDLKNGKPILTGSVTIIK